MFDYDNLFKILKKWYIWLALIFIIMPGLLYQVNIINTVNLSDYNGLSIIPLLIISVYYSLPYLILAFFHVLITDVKTRKSKKVFVEGDLFSIGIETLGLYWLNETISVSLLNWSRIAGYLAIILALIILTPIQFYLKEKK